jgi:hypothetical protein
LQPHVHESEHGMDQIVIQMQAFSGPRAEFDPLAAMVGGDFVRAAQLDRLEHADGALLDVVAGQNVSGDVFLAVLAAAEIENGSPGLLHRRQRLADHALGQLAAMPAEILEQDAMMTEVLEQPFGIREKAQRAMQHESIKT